MSDGLTTMMDLMRHGEPVGGRRYRGQTDDPLSETGWRQMRAAVGDQAPWHTVVSSPLSRCMEFAKELTERHGLPLEVDVRIKELGYGEWEGLTPDELLAADPDILQRFRNDPLRHAPPGAEPLAVFRERVLAAWEELGERHQGKHVLVIAHAGVIRLVVNHILGGTMDRLFRLHVPCAGITRIRIDHAAGLIVPQLMFHAGSL